MKKLLSMGLAVLLLVSCSSQQSADKDITIVATFYPVYEFTKQIVGDEATVDLLIEAGTEVHDFEPSPKDMARIKEADILVYENEHMETWLPTLQKNLKSDEVHLLKATEGMLLLPAGEEEHHHDHEEEGHHHAYDPHVWLSPERAITMVATIRDGLTKQYPAKKETFETNAAAYIDQLEELHQTYLQSLSAAKQKYVVTQHTAFAYLALDYGLKQVSITGVTANQEPTPARLAALTDYIKQYGIPYIYFEENASPALAQTLAKETGVELAVLDTLESLTQQAMADDQDYISIMKANLVALEKTTTQAGKEILPEDGEINQKTVYNGYFEDAAVKDRTLSDYAGNWQSVYPYLLDGTLDQVFDYKAKRTGKMTADEYKAYYQTGYKTDVEAIRISDDSIEFMVNGGAHQYSYKYVGYKILTYKKGNRGVRYLFEATDASAGEYRYVQFSDHQIAPNQTGHFHIFFGGESQEKLFDEMENWPTYYPDGLTGFEIAQEMVTH